MNVLEAEKGFTELVDKVFREGISVDLERDEQVIARLTPAPSPTPLKAGDLRAFLLRLPSLGDDAEAFAKDVRDVRTQLPPEASPWE